MVHDWIKAYIYQDMKDVNNHPRTCLFESFVSLQLFHRSWYDRIASLPTILISAAFHEYVLWAPVRFVLPLLLTMFGIFGSEFTAGSICISSQLPARQASSTLSDQTPQQCTSGITSSTLGCSLESVSWSLCTPLSSMQGRHA